MHLNLSVHSWLYTHNFSCLVVCVLHLWKCLSTWRTLLCLWILRFLAGMNCLFRIKPEVSLTKVKVVSLELSQTRKEWFCSFPHRNGISLLYLFKNTLMCCSSWDLVWINFICGSVLIRMKVSVGEGKWSCKRQPQAF